MLCTTLHKSDHYMYHVCFTGNVNYKLPKAEHITSNYRCFKKINENAFQSDLANVHQNFELNRPFLTNKGSQNSENIAISDNGKIITDTSEICEKFNTFFVNVAKDIGDGAGCLSRRTIQVSVRSGQIIHPVKQSLNLSLWMKLRSRVTWRGLAGERQLDWTLYHQKFYIYQKRSLSDLPLL